MFAFLRRLLARSTDEVVIECRHCGTVVDQGTSSCPACGTAEFARFEFGA